MVSSGNQCAPPKLPIVLLIVTGVPPVVLIFLTAPEASVNPIHMASGDQNGMFPFSAPGTFRKSRPSTARTCRLKVEKPVWTTAAICLPSGDKSMSPGNHCPGLGGAMTNLAAFGADAAAALRLSDHDATAAATASIPATVAAAHHVAPCRPVLPA